MAEIQKAITGAAASVAGAALAIEKAKVDKEELKEQKALKEKHEK